MKHIDTKSARMWSRLGQRGTIFGVALMELAESCPNIRVLTADLGVLSGLERFKSTYPDYFINAGIAEQNMLGIAAGLAKEGNCVFVTTYATFLSMRSLEQIRHHLGYQKQNVKIIAATAGLSMGMSGVTHYAIEDIAIMRAIPNMIVLSPADSAEAYKMAYAAAACENPMYIRLTGVLDTPVVYKSEYDFQVGKAVKLRNGDDVSIIATGISVSEALKAAVVLEEKGVSCSVWNMHTLKPLDTDAVAQAMQSKWVVTVEEHNCIGGLGGAVAEAIAEKGNFKGKLVKIGIPDQYGKADEYAELLNLYGLTSAGIADKILKITAADK